MTLFAQYPYALDAGGLTETASREEHIEQMVEEVLFTSPGERVNRPEFGCDIKHMVFENLDAHMTATISTLAQSALRRWLGDVIDVKDIKITTSDTEIFLDIQFVDILTQSQRQIRLSG